jgi:hypothetical protein
MFGKRSNPNGVWKPEIPDAAETAIGAPPCGRQPTLSKFGRTDLTMSESL